MFILDYFVSNFYKINYNVMYYSERARVCVFVLITRNICNKIHD